MTAPKYKLRCLNLAGAVLGFSETSQGSKGVITTFQASNKHPHTVCAPTPPDPAQRILKHEWHSSNNNKAE
jgi:hypothetical protein